MRTWGTSLVLICATCAIGQSFQRIYGNGQIWSPTAFAASSDAYYLLHNSSTDGSGAEIVKLDHEGDTIWALDLPYQGMRVAFGEGAVYTTLMSSGPDFPDNFLLKLDTAGNVVWANRTSYHPEDYLFNYNSRIHVLPDGVLAVGQMDMGGDYGSNYGITLSRYDANGELLWGKSYGSPYYSLNALASVLAPNGDVVVAGTRLTSLSPEFSTALMLARFTAQGDPVWMRAFADTVDLPGICNPLDLVTTNDGEYALLAERAARSVLVKFDDAGEMTWGQQLYTADPFWLRPRSLIQDSEDRFVIAGGGASFPSPDYVFLARLGSDGTVIDALRIADQGYAYAPLYTTTAFGQELVEQSSGQGYVISHAYSPYQETSWHALSTVDGNGMPGCPELGLPLDLLTQPYSWSDEPWLALPDTVMTMSGTLVAIDVTPMDENITDMCSLVTGAAGPTRAGTDLRIWPTPATDALTCEWTQQAAGVTRLELIDALGRAIQRTTLHCAVGPQRLTLPVADHARGIYLLRMIMGGSTTGRRVILE